MSNWSRRALVTLTLVAVAHALQFVPMPWIDLYEWGARDAFGGLFVVSRDTYPLSVAALGIVPLTSGLGLASLGYAIVPRLRQSLEQPGGETRLLRVGLYVSVPFALLQSTRMAMFVHNMAREETMNDQKPWLIGSLLWLFAILYSALPLALERWGLGRGLASAALLYCLLQVAAALHAIGFDGLVVQVEALPIRNLALGVMLVAATVGATRRWLGDAVLLPGEPRLDRIGRGLALALIALAALQSFGLQRIVDLANLGQLGQHVLSLGVAVGGGFLLADRAAVTPNRVGGAQLLALGTFLVFTAGATALLAEERVAMPWPAIVVATILLYMSWRGAQASLQPASDAPVSSV